MATMPMTPPAPTSESMEQATAAPGYRICINVSPDGQMSVGAEPMEAEEAGEQGEYTPVQGIKQAIEMAMQLYQSGGAMPDEGAADAEFASGLVR